METLRSAWSQFVFAVLSFIVRLANRHYVIVTDPSGLSRASKDALRAEVDTIRDQLIEAERLEEQWNSVRDDFLMDYYETLKVRIQTIKLGSRKSLGQKNRSVGRRKWMLILREMRKEGSR